MHPQIKYLHLRKARILCVVAGPVIMLASEARSDWISDIASIGLGASIDIAKAISTEQNLSLPTTQFESANTFLTIAQAVPEAFKLQQDYKLNLGAAVTEQAVISGSGWAAGKLLSTSVVAPCFASGACAIFGAGSVAVAGWTTIGVVGAGVDAVLIQKDVKAGIDLINQNRALAASQQQVAILQERINEQATLKQQLQAQQNTQQWQSQRATQVASQGGGSRASPIVMNSVSSTSAGPLPSSGAGLVQSTNQSLQMYSFKPLANGNVEIYENGKAFSSGGGFSVAFAQQLGYPSLSLQQTSATTLAAGLTSNLASVAPSGYTFTPWQNGMLQVSLNGLILGTITPQLAAQLYGFQGASSTVAPSSAAAPISSGNVTTRSGAVVNAATGQPVSPPPIGASSQTPASIPGGGVRSPTPSRTVSTAGGKSSTPKRTKLTLSSRSDAPPQSSQSPAQSANKQSAPQMATAPIAKPVIIGNVGPATASVATMASPRLAPGGISLRQAAVEQLPLNFTLDGAYIQNGRIILSGRKNTAGSIDAALFLTALRAACEGHDPYFSLDPDNMTEWLAESRQAGTELHETIDRELKWHFRSQIRRNEPSVPEFRTLSASRDYPKVWSSLLGKYSNLKSRLVFRPEWLQHTRFGEIMYRADVLLKELAGGAVALGESRFRAAKIDGYRSATDRMAGMRLLNTYSNWLEPEPVPGGRIWYDLTESSDAILAEPEQIPSGTSELRTMLEGRGLLTRHGQQSPSQTLTVNGAGIDLSSIYPRMFVRVSDVATHRDTSARYPGMDEFVAQANQKPELYASAYREYEQLVEIFRAYIVAVHAKQSEPDVCFKLPNELLEAEKVNSTLPAYHPTEFMTAIAWYEYQDGTVRRAISGTGGLFQGGVSMGVGKLLPSQIQAVTPVISELRLQAAQSNRGVSWNDNDGRRYVALRFDEIDPAGALSPTTANAEKNEQSATVAGTSGRFVLYGGARIEGTQLGSMGLKNHSTSGRIDADECARVCSSTSDCIAFEVDQAHNICNTYSTVFRTRSDPQWTHGIWR
jgi:hypothetical protein